MNRRGRGRGSSVPVWPRTTTEARATSVPVRPVLSRPAAAAQTARSRPRCRGRISAPKGIARGTFWRGRLNARRWAESFLAGAWRRSAAVGLRRRTAVAAGAYTCSLVSSTYRLALVHFSAHPEPDLSPELVTTQRACTSKVLTLSRKVDECEPLARGGGRSLAAHSTNSARSTGSGQGLPPVHFSAHSEPFLSLKPGDHPAYPTESAYVEPKSGRV